MDCRIKSGNDANNGISFSRRDRARAMPRHYEIRSRMKPAGPAFGRPDDRLRAIRATTLRKKKGKRNAGRRTSMSRIERMRPRVQRDALACRRSTTALTAATERRRSAPANALPGMERVRHGRYPFPAILQCSGLPRRPVIVPAGRIIPEPPGSRGDEPLPAGTASPLSAGVTRRRPYGRG